MLPIRPAAVAGVFYPAHSSELKVTALELLRADSTVPDTAVRALVVPHAGWIYSGAVAAKAYQLLSADHVHRVVIAGPAHRVAIRGIAVPSVAAFTTPLGDIVIDDHLRARALLCNGVQQRDDAHALEHAIEVQLPFLQVQLTQFTLLPLVVGACSADQVAVLFEQLITPDVLLIISTDLSHFLVYDDACARDHDTIHHILSRDTNLHGEQACGAYPLNGFLRFATQQGWQLTCLNYCNSGDTAGSKDRVVGYASFVAH